MCHKLVCCVSFPYPVKDEDDEDYNDGVVEKVNSAADLSLLAT